MKIPFVKVQAAGNDFVLVDTRDGVNASWPDLARDICRRHLGVGSDGLLVLEPSTVAQTKMRMFNPDGTEDMCANGLRCVARYLGDRVPSESIIESIAGCIPSRVDKKGIATIVLPPPSFRARDLPAAIEVERVWDLPLHVSGRELRLFGVSTGTPHAIIFCEEDLSEADFQHLSPLIENHSLFPQRVTVLWVRVESRNILCVRVWERGAGETLACGTGACAAVAITHTLNLTERRVKVTMKGGSLFVEWLADEKMTLAGSAEIVFRGVWESPGDRR